MNIIPQRARDIAIPISPRYHIGGPFPMIPLGTGNVTTATNTQRFNQRWCVDVTIPIKAGEDVELEFHPYTNVITGPPDRNGNAAKANNYLINGVSCRPMTAAGAQIGSTIYEMVNARGTVVTAAAAETVIASGAEQRSITLRFTALTDIPAGSVLQFNACMQTPSTSQLIYPHRLAFFSNTSSFRDEGAVFGNTSLASAATAAAHTSFTPTANSQLFNLPIMRVRGTQAKTHKRILVFGDSKQQVARNRVSTDPRDWLPCFAAAKLRGSRVTVVDGSAQSTRLTETVASNFAFARKRIAASAGEVTTIIFDMTANDLSSWNGIESFEDAFTSLQLLCVQLGVELKVIMPIPTGTMITSTDNFITAANQTTVTSDTPFQNLWRYRQFLMGQVAEADRFDPLPLLCQGGATDLKWRDASVVATMTVGTAGSTTTRISVDNLTYQAFNQLAEYAVRFTSGVLSGGVAVITASNRSGSTTVMDLDRTLASAPASGVTFEILQRRTVDGTHPVWIQSCIDGLAATGWFN